MNDYIYFVLNQKAILKELLKKYSLTGLSKFLLVQESTIQKWYYEKFQISTHNFNRLKSCIKKMGI